MKKGSKMTYKRKVSKPFTEEHRRKISLASKHKTFKWLEAMHNTRGRKQSKRWVEKRSLKLRGENNSRWINDDSKISYQGVHSWIQRWKKRPVFCENCGTTTAQKYEWANIDHKYRRVLGDYINLCTKCHLEYDRDKLGIKKGRKPKQI